MGGSPPDGAWVAVQVQSNMERRVFLGLKERKYESFSSDPKIAANLV